MFKTAKIANTTAREDVRNKIAKRAGTFGPDGKYTIKEDPDWEAKGTSRWPEEHDWLAEEAQKPPSARWPNGYYVHNKGPNSEWVDSEGKIHPHKPGTQGDIKAKLDALRTEQDALRDDVGLDVRQRYLGITEKIKKLEEELATAPRL